MAGKTAHDQIMHELGELKGIQTQMLKELTRGNQRMDNHSKRIRGVEKRQAVFAAVAAIAGAVAGAGLSQLIRKLVGSG